MTILRVENLTHRYGSLTALENITFTVPDGRIGLVGANGAGKTTLLKLMLGILTPASGTIEVMGQSVASDPLAVRARVGFMPEDACLPHDQTAADFVGYAAELAGLPTTAARRRASEVLYLVGLHEERFRHIGGFSTGMTQRVKLAQAIVHDPDLVLLDEPASGLDPEGREEMLRLITRLGEFGISVMFSSHIIDDIEATCDWVVMLDGGALLRSEPLEDLGARDTITVDIIGDATAVATILTNLGATTEQTGQRLEVRNDRPAILDWIRDAIAESQQGVHRLGSTAMSLEEAFFVGESQ